MITLTTTTICSSLDDLTDSLDALREIGVGSWSMTGTITYDDRTEAESVLSAAALDELSAAHERAAAQEAVARGYLIDTDEAICTWCGEPIVAARGVWRHAATDDTACHTAWPSRGPLEYADDPIADGCTCDLDEDACPLHAGASRDYHAEALDEIQALRDERDDLRAEIDRLRSYNDQLRDRIRDCEEDFLTMSRRRDDLALRIEGYEADMNGMQSIVDATRAELESSRVAHLEMATLAEGRLAHVKMLDAALATQRAESDHMEAALNAIRSEMNPSCQCDQEEEVWSEHYDGCPVFKGALIAMNHALELGIAATQAAQS